MEFSLRHIAIIFVFQLCNWCLFFILPREYTILNITISAYLIGAFFPVQFRKNAIPLFICGTSIWVMLWFVSNSILNEPNSFLIYPLPLLSFLLILAGSKFTFRSMSFLELGIWSFLLLFAPVTYSYLGNENWGIWGRLLIFFLVGLSYGFSGQKKIYGIFLVIPSLIALAVQRFMNGPEEYEWLFFIIHPLNNI